MFHDLGASTHASVVDTRTLYSSSTPVMLMILTLAVSLGLILHTFLIFCVSFLIEMS